MESTMVLGELTGHVIGSQNEGGRDTPPYTVYVIKVRWKNKEWSITHRFRDFDTLRQNLSLYISNLPSLPKKTWFGRNLDPSFIRQRCQDLDEFLQVLLKTEAVLEIPYFYSFLSLNKNTVSGADINKSLTVDDFELLKTLGQGSFGKVLQVLKKDTNKIYAMKILKKSELVRRKQVTHTRTERRVLEDIDHPFIVSLRFAFQTSEKLYMVMDFFTGGELFFHLKKAGRFTEDRARFYMAEILLAFEHLHKMNIVYRDLKPENVLLDQEGHVRLTDFGLSKDFDSGGATLTRTFCGTPEYLAPEVIRRKDYGQLIDWWSFGTLLFELLAGAPPFMHQNQKVMYERILHADIPFTRHMSTLSKAFISVLLKKNPQQRLGSIGGAREVKAHSFFAVTDFEKLLAKEVTPPFKPKVKDSSDVQNIDEEFKCQEPTDTPGTVNSGLGALDFPEFTFIPSEGRSVSTRMSDNSSIGGSLLRKPMSQMSMKGRSSTLNSKISGPSIVERQKVVKRRMDELSVKSPIPEGLLTPIVTPSESRGLSHLSEGMSAPSEYLDKSLDKS